MQIALLAFMFAFVHFFRLFAHLKMTSNLEFFGDAFYVPRVASKRHRNADNFMLIM